MRYLCLLIFTDEPTTRSSFELLPPHMSDLRLKDKKDHVTCDVSKEPTSVPAAGHQEEDVSVGLDAAERTAPELRIVLFGKSDDKKAALGNIIVRKKEFSVPGFLGGKQCEAVHGTWNMKPLTVVKTPDVFSLSVEKVREEMKRCVDLCSPGPNVLLLLVKPSDFTEENRKTLKFILSLFGEDSFKHSMVISTYNHQWNETSVSVNQLLQECDGRHYKMFTNDHGLFMEKIENIVHENKRTFLTFTEETRRSKSEPSKPKEMEKILKKEDEMKRKMEELERKHEEEMKRRIEEERTEIEEERKVREKQLQEKEENIKKEREERKKEQKMREEEEKNRKELEENQRQKWKQEREALERKIRSESKEKGTIDRKLEESRREMKENQETWEKEQEEWWRNRGQEDEQRRQEEQERLRKLQEEYDQERQRHENQRREEDRIKRAQEERERKEKEEGYKKTWRR
ncbi:GTPase IMAP family member 4-like isoform X1 [Acanthochromis polyacanthus]|uniref:GTPase IMAP family member 4-like isoform X1 n=2 Tax=Acanthochromis polyacanthus TaxID=80966 RepID=UPI0022340F30|nr:GTPase IMAP family member 4-like isoform X1 [Acanthochromis polyacanthus]